mmetsp:Transcript_100929/g.323965  ORF Transcript_100929/g.323965 Transcript_100929/m.323965 type:complete len:207 (-) Transcript_100929:300-920(-)
MHLWRPLRRIKPFLGCLRQLCSPRGASRPPSVSAALYRKKLSSPSVALSSRLFRTSDRTSNPHHWHIPWCGRTHTACSRPRSGPRNPRSGGPAPLRKQPEAMHLFAFSSNPPSRPRVGRFCQATWPPPRRPPAWPNEGPPPLALRKTRATRAGRERHSSRGAHRGNKVPSECRPAASGRRGRSGARRSRFPRQRGSPGRTQRSAPR